MRSERRAAIIQASLPFSVLSSWIFGWMWLSCCTAAALRLRGLCCLISRGIKADYWPLFSGVCARLNRAVISCNALVLWFSADDLIRRAAGRSPHLLYSFQSARSDLHPELTVIVKEGARERRSLKYLFLSKWESWAAFLFTHKPVGSRPQTRYRGTGGDWEAATCWESSQCSFSCELMEILQNFCIIISQEERRLLICFREAPSELLHVCSGCACTDVLKDFCFNVM